MSNFEVMGIGLNTSQARYDPKPELETTAPELAGQSTGQIFVAIKDNNPTIPNALKMLVNGMEVCIKDNQKWIQTNTAQPPESGHSVLPIDFPMRFIDGVAKPSTYSIIFVMGVIENEKFLEDDESDEYYLTITSDELPVGTTDN